MRSNLSIVDIAYCLSIVLGGCGGGSSSPLPPNPVPSVSSLSPSSATTCGTPFTLTVNGKNFISTSAVQWNGASRATSYVSATELTAAITAADITAAATSSVTVVNPAPGGGTSPAASFYIDCTNQVSIDAQSPGWPQ
jgi:IPT/TIG domain